MNNLILKISVMDNYFEKELENKIFKINETSLKKAKKYAGNHLALIKNLDINEYFQNIHLIKDNFENWIFNFQIQGEVNLSFSVEELN